MLELLFVAALVAMVLIEGVLFLSHLPAAPTLMVATLAIPALFFWMRTAWLRRSAFSFLLLTRKPVPPEHFFLALHSMRITRFLWVSLPFTVAAWIVADFFPAQLEINTASILGWISGITAIFLTALQTSLVAVYFQAWQRVDENRPKVIGWMRGWLYRASENTEFLGKQNPTRHKTEKRIY